MNVTQADVLKIVQPDRRGWRLSSSRVAGWLFHAVNFLPSGKKKDPAPLSCCVGCFLSAAGCGANRKMAQASSDRKNVETAEGLKGRLRRLVGKRGEFGIMLLVNLQCNVIAVCSQR